MRCALRSCATPVLLLCYSCARVPFQVHLPEYKGWHNREPTPLNAAWTWKPEPGNGLPVNPKTRVSRGPNYRVSENCGFAWDPGASYGPETIAALPTADDKLKEDLFDETQDQATDALTAIAEGDTPEIAKPMTGLGSGIWELAIKERGDAFRVIYALQLDDDIWVVHAFQKKSKSGIATPKQEIDLVRERIKRLKEALR